MRIVSLLPSLTELVCLLGRRDELVGVTHECDFPVGVERLPHLTASRIPTSASSADIDTMVSAEGGSLYELDRERLGALEPDLILTQEQCDVCAVNEATVRRVAAALPGSPQVESVNPTSLASVHATFRRIGALLDASPAAEAIIAQFEATAAEVARRHPGWTPRRVLMLEWFDPPFSSGHWNPEIVSLAGGVETVSEAGERSRRLSWSDVARAEPEVVLLTPCGFSLARSETELGALQARPEWRTLPAARDGNVFLVDGSAYFSRPGPRLEMSLRIAAAAIDPASCGDMAPAEAWRRLPPLA